MALQHCSIQVQTKYLESLADNNDTLTAQVMPVREY